VVPEVYTIAAGEPGHKAHRLRSGSQSRVSSESEPSRPPERLDALDAGAIGQRCQHGSLARRHNGDARARVAQQVVTSWGELATLIGTNTAHAQAGDIKHYASGTFRLEPQHDRHGPRRAASVRMRDARIVAQSLIAELSTRRSPENNRCGCSRAAYSTQSAGSMMDDAVVCEFTSMTVQGIMP